MPENYNNRILIVALVVAAFLIGALSSKVSFLEKNASTTQATQTPTAPNQAPISKVDVDLGHLPFLGDKNAKVAIVEFGDFQCPFCERFYKQVEKQLIKEYADSGKVKFAFRHYAFLDKKNFDPNSDSRESTWAALASECANEQGKFWEYHDYLYENQGAENSGAFNKDKLVGFAKILNLNTQQFSTCLESEKYAKNVEEDLAFGQKAGVNGTPATFVNGQIIVGAQPYSAFKTIIDQELGKSK